MIWSAELIYGIAIVLYVTLGFAPMTISGVRRCVSHETIKTLGIGGILIPPLWIVAVVWAFRGRTIAE